MPTFKTAEEYIARQRSAIAANPECGTSHYNLAIGLMGQKKFKEAEQELHMAIECSPTLAEAYVQLGGLRLREGDLDGCLKYNQLSTKVRAGFSEGFGNIGFVHMQKGNLEEAIRALEKAVTYNTSFLQALTTLANAYLMTGEVDKSIETNKKALEVEPDFPVAHNNLAIGYLEKGRNEDAVKHFDRAVELGYEAAPELKKEIDGLR